MSIQNAQTKGKPQLGKRFTIDGYKNDLHKYNHYIAVDWHLKKMTIARMTRKNRNPIVIDAPSDIADLQGYLKNLKGKIILTIEETTTSQWLYVELLEYVDRIVICNPHRNRLLEDGPKNDKIDAGKLCQLLGGGLVKEVYHTTDELYKLRKLERAYTTLVKSGVRLSNQKAALYRGLGKSYAKEELIDEKTEVFILGHINNGLESYRQMKKSYESEIRKLRRKNPLLRNLCDLPGINTLLAFRIVSIVVDAYRFPTVGHYLVYCGLVKYKRESGGKNYGKRTPRYSRTLKSVYRTATEVALLGKNPMRDYYDYLREKGVAHQNAKNAVARYLARVSYGMMKNGTTYEPYRWRKKQ